MADLPAIPQLNSNNVHLWKIKIVQHLRPRGLAQYVQTNVPAPDAPDEYKKWEQERVAVIDIILAHSEDVIDQLVEDGGWDMDTQDNPKDLVDIAMSLFSKKKKSHNNDNRKSTDARATEEHQASSEHEVAPTPPQRAQNGSPLDVTQQQDVLLSSVAPASNTLASIASDDDEGRDVQIVHANQFPRNNSLSNSQAGLEGSPVVKDQDSDDDTTRTGPRVKRELKDEEDFSSAPSLNSKIIIDLTEEDDTSEKLQNKLPKVEEDRKPLLLDLTNDENLEDRLPQLHEKLETSVPQLAVALERRTKAYEKFDATRKEVRLLRQELDQVGSDAAPGLEDIIQQRDQEMEKLRQDFQEADAAAQRLRDESAEVYKEAKALCKRDAEMLSRSMDRDINLIE